MRGDRKIEGLKKRRPIPAFLGLLLILFSGSNLAVGGSADFGAIRANPLSQPSLASPMATHADQSVDPRAAELAARLREHLSALSAAKQSALTQSSSTPRRQGAQMPLRSPSGETVEVRIRPSVGTPMQMKTSTSSVSGRAIRGATLGREHAIDTARAFLHAHHTLLRLDDTENELRVLRREADDLGYQHVRFTQTYQGLPVWPAELIVHINPAGQADLLNGAFVPTPRAVNTAPLLDEKTAMQHARSAVPGGDSADVVDDPELIVYAPGDKASRLAWKIELPISLTARWLVVIDAQTGTTLTAYNQVMEANVAGSGTDLFGMTRPLNVWENDGSFFMIDTSKPMFNPALNPLVSGTIFIKDAQNQPPTSNPQQIPPLFSVTSATPTSGWLPDAVSASFGLSQTYDYYLERHNRNSFDGQGSTILGVVRYGQGFPNAFWWNGQLMAFGDAQPYAGALDVVAHELTHGVTQYSANLVYQNQPGALNEAFSDILGEMVEARTFGGPDWINGAVLSGSRRNLRNPSSVEIIRLRALLPVQEESILR